MIKLIGLIGATAGGYLGWWLGKVAGSTGAAFILSMVGSGFGMYYAARWARNNLT